MVMSLRSESATTHLESHVSLKSCLLGIWLSGNHVIGFLRLLKAQKAPRNENRRRPGETEKLRKILFLITAVREPPFIDAGLHSPLGQEPKIQWNHDRASDANPPATQSASERVSDRTESANERFKQRTWHLRSTFPIGGGPCRGSGPFPEHHTHSAPHASKGLLLESVLGSS